MNAKKFLLGAACALGLCLSSTAQTNPVYSVNAVGYVKTALPFGFTLICNPLNVSSNGSSQNTLNNLIPSAPSGTAVFKFNGTSFGDPALFFAGSGWDPNLTLNPGEGAFIYSPVATNVVFAGEVLQGNLTNVVLNGFSVISSMVPQSARLADLGFPGASGDVVYIFNSATQQFEQDPYLFFSGVGWSPGNPAGPVIPAGGSFFILNSGTSKNWVRSFSVNN